MIIKSFEINKINLDLNNLFLFYGKNNGFKDEFTKNIIKKKNICNYEEKEILENKDNFIENLLTKSLFDEQKIIIIKRSTDKILNIIEELYSKKIENIIILNADNLEKKSKLRNFFEKSSKTICIPFYEDNNQTLVSLVQKFLLEKKIKISSENINLIVERARGDRINLYNELNKIDVFSKSKKRIEADDILKLTNLSENFSIYDLVDNSLAKNKKKTLNILNENNFAVEDCILILRIFLAKLKRLLKIQKELEIKKNIERVLVSFKPPIFWKEKEIVKEQVKILNYDKIKNLIVEVNNIEFLVKKYPSTALNITTNFILEQAIKTNN